MLRDFQFDIENKVFAAWAEPNVFNVMPIAPTGSGKTVLVGDIIKKMDRPTAPIAHRQELVAQMALAMNRERIPHGIIAPKAVIQSIIAAEHETHGFSDYAYRADTRISGIDTLIRHDKNDRWLSQVGLVVIDEGHHVQRENKWGRGVAMFPNARGLYPTAHGVRADGAGLGRYNADGSLGDGLVDAFAIGPSPRDLIDRGFLTDYDVFCPDSDIDFSDVPIGTTGDYSMPRLRAATHKSNQVVGSAVRHYLRHAAGKLGITFAIDIAAAKELATAYRLAGVPTEIITGETPITVRAKLLRQFKQRQILQLVSVDCLGEGVDVPAVEVVSLVRRTASWQLFCQQIGRALRILVSDELNAQWGTFTDAERLMHIAASDKPKAIIIDHVGNVLYHAEKRGLFDSKQEYSMFRGETRPRGIMDALPLRSCIDCTRPYQRFLLKCPYCGCEPIAAGRSTPQQVDGDLTLLTPEILAAIRGDLKKVDGPAPKMVDSEYPVRAAIQRRHRERQDAQADLRKALALWGGWRDHVGESTREAQKRFFLTFGVDVMTAQTLGVTEAGVLQARVREHLARFNVVEFA